MSILENKEQKELWMSKHFKHTSGNFTYIKNFSNVVDSESGLKLNYGIQCDFCKAILEFIWKEGKKN